MKVLLFNGSTRTNGCTYLALSEISKTLEQEGLQTMRNLGRNMAWMLRCIEAGKEKGVTPPAAETRHWTNFNR